ncbi:MAG: class I SAM-dependent methyltransferase [Acidobacteriota bacterium]|nr:class I SAM-dependent methyltransferase [Acidobacteriota bacterium]
MRKWAIGAAKRQFLRALEGMTDGFVELVCPDGTYAFGDAHSDLRGLVAVHDERFFLRALTGGDTGMGESWMDGDWSSPDLVAVVRLALRNTARLEAGHRWTSAVRRLADRMGQWRRANTPGGSRRNIHAHYDLGNDFFSLFLDRRLVYSCAYFSHPGQSLEEAQVGKLDRICRKLDLRPTDRVLEIGTGWGAFAIHAAREYGCHVTTTTISREQYEYVRARLETMPEVARRITLRCQDYRELTGTFDRLVSIEMFEAVGFAFYDRFFAACDRLLAPDGAMLLQTITMQDQRFRAYLQQADWTQKYIFPGGQLASMAGMLASVQRATRLTLHHAEEIGVHYARTLEAWRERFLAVRASVRAQGFDERFIRMWDFYLGSCAAAFRERYIGDVQLLLARNGCRRALLNEPWRDGPGEGAPARGTAGLDERREAVRGAIAAS